VLKQITGASLLVKGQLVASQGKGQAIELAPDEVQIVGECDPSSPVQKAGTSFEFLREVAHMRPRTNTFGAVFRLRSRCRSPSTSSSATGASSCATPRSSRTSDCEGRARCSRCRLGSGEASERRRWKIDFSKDFFAEKCSLTVSGQLEAEILAMSLGKSYTFGPPSAPRTPPPLATPPSSG